MWILVIVAISGGSTASTQGTLAMCQHNFRATSLADVKDAYCRSATGDTVYLVKDRVSYMPPS